MRFFIGLEAKGVLVDFKGNVTASDVGSLPLHGGTFAWLYSVSMQEQRMRLKKASCNLKGLGFCYKVLGSHYRAICSSYT